MTNRIAVRSLRAESIIGTTASTHLDLFRGLAAVAVLIYHVRYRFFLDYADVPDPALHVKLFYTATSFGHDAVMIFFVLSGYFISSSVTRSISNAEWSWAKYATIRLTRLWVVVIPGIALTLAWDAIGLKIHADHAVYTGGEREWTNDFFDVAARSDALTAIGNATFVQTILVPPLGSNEPLWSLAFEWWYYVLFPIGLIAAIGHRGWLCRAAHALAGVAISLFVGRIIIIYMPIWLLGAIIGSLPRAKTISRKSIYIPSAVAASVFFCGMHNLRPPCDR